MVNMEENDLIKERNQRLRNWMQGKPAPPLSVELAPTLRCNLNCLFCWRYGISDIDYGFEMSDDDYRRIIKEGKALGVLEWRIIGGGDAIVRKHLCTEIMLLIKKLDMRGYICTNGLLFDKGDIKSLVAKRWDHIKFSFESHISTIHDRLVNRAGAFDKAVEIIGGFVAEKQRQSSSKPYLELGAVLTNLNYRDLVGFIRFSSQLGVDALFIEPITVYTPMGESLKLSKEQLIEFNNQIDYAIKLSQKLRINTNLPSLGRMPYIDHTSQMDKLMRVLAKRESPKSPFMRAACYEAWYRMGIRADGKTCPCGFDDPDSTEYATEKSLEEIWYGEYFTSKRRHFLEGKLSAQCRKCCSTLIDVTKQIRASLLES